MYRFNINNKYLNNHIYKTCTYGLCDNSNNQIIKLIFKIYQYKYFNDLEFIFFTYFKNLLETLILVIII